MSPQSTRDTNISCKWKRIETVDDRCGGRFEGNRFHFKCAAAGSFIYCFGGYPVEENSHTIFVLDVRTYKWTRFTPSGCFPKINDSHAAVLVDDKIYSIGGRGASRFHNGVFALDLISKEWQRLPLLQRDLDACYGHSADFVEKQQRIVVHLEAEPSNKTFAISLDRSTSRLVRTGGKAPSSRRYHASCVSGSNLYIFGGVISQDTVSAELFVLSLSKTCERGNWSQVKSGKTLEGPPAARNASLMCLRGRLVVFGGVPSTTQTRVYALDDSQDSWRSSRVLSGERHPSGRACKFHEAISHGASSAALVIAGIGSSVYEVELLPDGSRKVKGKKSE